MKTQIASLKQECKKLAEEIRTLKSKRKELRGYVPGLGSAQTDFRIKHIAYCLLRGRTLEQIENKLRDPNDYNHKYCRDRAAALVKKVQEEAANEQVVCASPQ